MSAEIKGFLAKARESLDVAGMILNAHHPDFAV